MHSDLMMLYMLQVTCYCSRQGLAACHDRSRASYEDDMDISLPGFMRGSLRDSYWGNFPNFLYPITALPVEGGVGHCCYCLRPTCGPKTPHAALLASSLNQPRAAQQCCIVMPRIRKPLWFLQVGPRQDLGPQSVSRLYVSLCPPDIVAIFKALISLMDLSDRDLSRIPPRNLSDQEKRIKVSLTALFPGRTDCNHTLCNTAERSN